LLRAITITPSTVKGKGKVKKLSEQSALRKKKKPKWVKRVRIKSAAKVYRKLDSPRRSGNHVFKESRATRSCSAK